MRKKLCLLSGLLVLSLAVVATAEDICGNIPSFAGADGSCAIWWDFEEPYPNADDWIYTPDPDPEFYADDNLEEGWGEGVFIWPEEQESRFYFTMPEGTGDYLTVFVQLTWTEVPEEYYGFPEGWTAPADAGGDHLGGEEEEVEISDACEISPGLYYATMASTWDMDGEDPALAAFLIGGTSCTVDQIVIDAIRHPDPFPPAGPGRRCFKDLVYVSNISPAEDERHAPLDTNLSFQAPEDAFCIDPNAAPNLAGPFEYDVYFGAEPNVLTMTQLADGFEPTNCNDVMVFDPCAGNFPLATTYYWRVDINDADGGGDPCFYEGPYFSFSTIGLADNIAPADGAGDASVYADLKWAGDVWADTFDVYFSTDFSDVDNGVALVSDDQGPNTYDPGTLVLGTEYFWRIDEVNGFPIKGDIWNFTTDISTVVDNMDTYDISNRISDIWLDYWTIITRAEVLLETAIVEDGNSMALFFNNTVKLQGNIYGSWTEASISDLAVGSDWNEINGKALSLSFYGNPTNTVGPNDKMYVTLVDASANVGISYYPDVNDVKIPEWQQWNIDLEDFNSAGVDLSNVSKIAIGFGTYDGSETPGIGEGNIYIDNILLFTTRCVQAEAPGDATGDCTVNGDDIMELQVGWLETDYEVPPEEPNRDGLMVEYLFDGYEDYSDTSGEPYYHGIPGYFASVGTNGYLTLTGGLGGENIVEIPLASANPFDGSQDYTISFKFRSGEDSYSTIFSSSDEDVNDADDPNHQATHPFAIFFELTADDIDSLTVSYDQWYVMTLENSLDEAGLVNEWQYYAVTYEVDGGICPDWGDEYNCPPDTVTGLIMTYLNGIPIEEAGNWDPNIPEIGDDKVWIGDVASPAYKDDLKFIPFTGDIDEVRIYDSALPHSNIMWLADKPVPIYFPLEEESNLYPKVGPYGFDPNNVDIVDFKDFAVIAENWLAEEKLWP